MTRAPRFVPAAALAVLLIQAAPRAQAEQAVVNPAEPSRSVPSPFGASGIPPFANSLLPVLRSPEEIAAAQKAQDLKDVRSNAWRRRWMLSLAPLAASEGLDAASSWGLRELNPVLAGSDGRFGMKAAGIKFGVVGGLVGVEAVLIKKFPAAAKFFSVVNFSTAGITAGLAVHNYNLPGR